MRFGVAAYGRILVVSLLALAGAFGPIASGAALAASPTTWQVDVGAQSPDMAIQADYYFARAITIDAGDSVQWNWQSAEPHSVTFNQQVGGSTIDTGLQFKGFAYTLQFNTPGTYTYHCEIHPAMTGQVVVQNAGAAYPQSQQSYNSQSAAQKGQLLGEGFQLLAQGTQQALSGGGSTITVGIGAAHFDQGGSVDVMRFLSGVRTAKVGETLTFHNADAGAPHTVTFNPNDAIPFFLPYGLDNNTLPGHATIGSTTQSVNSGILWVVNLPFFPYRGTDFQVTFTAPGTYNYRCELHDELGMTGQVIVTQ